MNETEQKIRSGLGTRWLGRAVYYYEETDSTNVRAKELAADGAPDGTVVLAGKQTAGRGRRGRSWHSPSGENLYMSIVTKPEMPAEKVPVITLVTACAAAKVLRKMTGLPVQIKWPNDLVADGRKLCGILTEMIAAGGKSGLVITGVGINVNMTQIPEELLDKAVSIELLTGQKMDLADLAVQLLDAIEEAYDIFFRDQSLDQFQEAYNELLVNRGARVCVLDPAGNYEGISEGIDAGGNLIVEKAGGEVVKVYAGEVSVRGLYGYV